MPPEDEAAANGAPSKEASHSKESTKTSGDKPTEAGASGKPDGTISAAEMKKRKKEEKAARRAQAKESQGLPPQAQKQDGAGENSKPPKGAPNTTPKSQPQKRRMSMSKQPPTKPAKELADKAPVKLPRPRGDKQVALFGHLYGQPRRTTLENASRDVHPAVLALGLKMSSYTICGSTARCVAMLLAFKKVIESYTTPPGTSLPRHLTSHLSLQIDYLVSCRPLATSMGNAIRWLKLEINDVDPDTEEDHAKSELCDSIDVFIRDRITAAGQLISETAQDKIQDGDVIVTFAKSNIVQQTFVRAFEKGRDFRVIVLDSRPLHEGRNMAKSLAEAGLDVTYSAMNALSYHIARATKVFLGAHAMLGNGRLYSRAGSALVAMCASSADLPVIVCCESVKFTDRVALDSIVTNEVAPPDELVPQGSEATALSQWKDLPNLQLLNLMYDVTPAEYISMVITEHGSLPPSSVPVVHRLSTNT